MILLSAPVRPFRPVVSVPPPTAPEAADEQLLRECAEGREASLSVLYRRRAPLVRVIAFRVVNSAAEAEDVVQDVFLEIWHQAGRFLESKGSGLAWITTLARRRAIDRLRRKQAYLRAQDRYRDDAFTESGTFSPPSPDGGAMAADRARAVQQVMSTLPAAQQQVVDFAFFRGCSQRETALRTGIPLGTIKTRLELALRKIRAAILTPDGGTAEWAYLHA